ncbi:YcaO-like family protein [Mesorhizobium sp. CGMCC 1.15528]|uniref:YcaO-like family protein n=1 Tax=Mesorhizobium zhangyense TaxID=1776730 RepID=A0A7C9V3V5_9HYPH|nr:YcaO-like family protein [Mesorhizobium zhangyense]NGN39945.1 YcaO-like family protein [Mesorhizobium zhangyense]
MRLYDNSHPSFLEFSEALVSAPPNIGETIQRVLDRRQEFGISRLGSITGLDRIGIAVAQAVRPDARSVVVSQGSGLTVEQAAISALMEGIENWAAEHVSRERVRSVTVRNCPDADMWADLWALMPEGCDLEPLGWIDGWDILSSRKCSVPLALVDACYTLPSPHAPWLPRNTTGLAAGANVLQAVRHACLEILERDARCWALGKPHFFDRYQVETASLVRGAPGKILARLRQSGMETGVWSIPSAHGLPIYWCHVMEGERQMELAPLPAEGFACGLSNDEALSKALLEACRSRLTAMAGAREDVTIDLYRGSFDRHQLASWRKQLGARGSPLPPDPIPVSRPEIDVIIDALRSAGATAVVVVPLFVDQSIPAAVVRVVAPPLRTSPEELGHGM